MQQLNLNRRRKLPRLRANEKLYDGIRLILVTAKMTMMRFYFMSLLRSAGFFYMRRHIVLITGVRRVAPPCELSTNHHHQLQQQQIWNHLLRMYTDARRLPPEMLSALSPFSSAAVMMTSSSASLSPSSGRNCPTGGSSFQLATSVCDMPILKYMQKKLMNDTFVNMIVISL